MCFLRALFGGRFKPSKFKTLAKLAISKSSILKKRQEVQYLQEKSDVIELLNRGEQERALLRVHLVIKYENMIDAFEMIEEYCHLLTKRVELLKVNEECPDELKEAISSLIFASSRIGEFPELKKMRSTFVSKFGRELAARAVELRNNCGVNSQIIQKLSDGQPSLKSKYKALHNIASENGISLQLENDPFAIAKEKSNAAQQPKRQGSYKPAIVDNTNVQYESPRATKKYRDAAEAAEDAFESAAFAAAAAKAAVELSIIESAENDEGDHSASSRGSSRRHGPMYVMVMGR